MTGSAELWAKSYQNYLANFIRTGDPNGKSSPYNKRLTLFVDFNQIGLAIQIMKISNERTTREKLKFRVGMENGLSLDQRVKMVLRVETNEKRNVTCLIN